MKRKILIMNIKKMNKYIVLYILVIMAIIVNIGYFLTLNDDYSQSVKDQWELVFIIYWVTLGCFLTGGCIYSCYEEQDTISPYIRDTGDTIIFIAP